MTLHFKSTLTGLAAALLIGGGGTSVAAQDAFPSKPIILVATGTIGGGADTQARLVADAIDKAGLIDEPVAVLNRGTAGSQEAYQFVRARAGDSHYLLTVTNQFVTYPMVGDAGYAWTEFTPIANLVLDPVVVVVPADSPIQDLKGLADAASAAGGAMTVGGGQIGTQDHMGFLTLAKATGMEARYVAFAGGGETHRNILGKQVDVAVGNPSDFLQSVEAGNLRVIGILDEERNASPLLAEVPTAREQGYDATFVVWRGWVAPPDISEEDRASLISFFEEVSNNENFRVNYVERFGLRPVFFAGDELGDFIAEQEKIYTELLREAGVIN
jgi:putative tricarboxylic transport membrane protein